MTANETSASTAISTPHAVIAEILEQERTKPRPGKPKGLSKADIPSDVCSRTTYNMLIKGTYPKVNPSMIRDLMDDIFHSDPELIREVRELARATHEERWWEAYRSGIADNSWLAIQREERASRIVSHTNNFVPVLAQSVEFLSALFDSLKKTVKEHDVDLDAAYQLRLGRLERWEDSEQPLTCVIGEAGLRIDLGVDVREAQMRHLLKLHELPHVEIFVVPFSAGRYSVLQYEFSILEFDDGPESLIRVAGLSERYLTPDSRHGRFFRDGITEAKNMAISIKEYADGSA
ncbi:Scr1 family TA system antitoxin-like transcriptional regulator [Glycomyces sp. MUSA5-2]|uniref:Scr1 family TA system antitoxin-like transcriptional regulator n=1 Tax=Glycomyces sp. MUSA5-2 TaxID=2053002 RepID=UPI00300A323B